MSVCVQTIQTTGVFQVILVQIDVFQNMQI